MQSICKFYKHEVESIKGSSILIGLLLLLFTLSRAIFTTQLKH